MNASGWLPRKPCCTWRVAPAAGVVAVPVGFAKTIQPVAQLVEPEQAVSAAFAEHTVTYWPSRSASPRAYWRSPSSELISEDMRYELVMLVNAGTPTATSIATMHTTTTSSTSVTPDCRFMERTVPAQA